MAKHKNQHYIPQCYLKAWCDLKTPDKQEPYVWQFSKDGSSARNKAPENIFYEKDMYTILDANGNRDLSLEHGLNELETRFSLIRDRKLKQRKPLTSDELTLLCTFVAAMDARTKVRRDHEAKHWSKTLEKMDKLSENMMRLKPEQRQRRIDLPPSSPSLTHEQVRHIASQPIQHFLGPWITTLSPLLAQMDIVVLGTNDPVGFITCDHPCIWFDPQAYKRPPFYQTPALMYPTTEIRFPLSPQQIIVFNQMGVNGYASVNEKGLDEFNRCTRFNAHDYFIVISNIKKDIWFDPGVEPEDSWRKQNLGKKDSI